MYVGLIAHFPDFAPFPHGRDWIDDRMPNCAGFTDKPQGGAVRVWLTAFGEFIRIQNVSFRDYQDPVLDGAHTAPRVAHLPERDQA